MNPLFHIDSHVSGLVLALTIGIAASPAASSKVSKQERQELLELAAKEAPRWGVPACLAKVIVKHESAGNYKVVGHDENYTGENTVPARTHFLRGGRTYSGAHFAPTTKALGESIKNDDGVGHNRKYADLGNAPHFGIDWRFSHGFGLGQITFGGRSGCRVDGKKVGAHCTVQGEKVEGDFCRVDGELIRGTKVKSLGRCVTVPWLLTKEGGVQALVARLSSWYEYARRKLDEDPTFVSRKCKTPDTIRGESKADTLIRGAFAAYGAGGKMGNTCRNSTSRRVRRFNECLALEGGSATPAQAKPANNANRAATQGGPVALARRLGKWVRSQPARALASLRAAVKRWRGRIPTADSAWITASSLRVRQAANKSSNPVGLVRRCDEVRVLGRTGSWVEIEHHGRIGFANAKYVSEARPAACR